MQSRNPTLLWPAWGKYVVSTGPRKRARMDLSPALSWEKCASASRKTLGITKAGNESTAQGKQAEEKGSGQEVTTTLGAGVGWGGAMDDQMWIWPRNKPGYKQSSFIPFSSTYFHVIYVNTANIHEFPITTSPSPSNEQWKWLRNTDQS